MVDSVPAVDWVLMKTAPTSVVPGLSATEHVPLHADIPTSPGLGLPFTWHVRDHIICEPALRSIVVDQFVIRYRQAYRYKCTQSRVGSAQTADVGQLQLAQQQSNYSYFVYNFNFSHL